MTDVQNPQEKAKGDMASEDKVCTNGSIGSSEMSECKRISSVGNDVKEAENHTSLSNGLNGVGDPLDKDDISEKSKVESNIPCADDKLNDESKITAGGDSKKLETVVTNKNEGRGTAADQSSDKQIALEGPTEANGVAEEDAPRNIESSGAAAEKSSNDTEDIQSTDELKNQINDVKPVEDESHTESEPNKDAKPVDDKKENDDKSEENDGLKDQPFKKSESEKDAVNEPTSTVSEKGVEDENAGVQDVTVDEKNQTDKTDEPKEEPKTSSEALADTSVEKMEVDEPDSVQGDSNATTGNVEKDSALSNPCRVVIEKLEGDGNTDETTTESSAEVNKGTKRKHSAETEASPDDSPTDGKPDGEEEKGVAHKKIKLDETVEKDANDTEPTKVEDSSNKNDDVDTARKSGRLSAKSKDVKSDEEQSPSTRRSSRSSIKNNQPSQENEKSPNKKSAQSTPNSTPKKSVTPSPKSRGKKDADSPEENAASMEGEKTPPKGSKVDANSKTKRKLESDGEDDENTEATNSSKRQRRSAKSTIESNDEEESVEEDSTPVVKKGRPSKAKTPKRTKSAKKAATEDAQSSAPESDNEGDDSVTPKGRGSKKSRGSTQGDKIDKMKKLLSAANLRINNYSKFWKDCKTDDEKADKILEYLRENGLEGNPTIENCKQLRKKREMEKEIAALNKSNILDTSGNENVRVTRSRRSQSKRD